MIRTIADLLEALRSRESAILDAEDISHPGAIGSMYEGLTSELLKYALPPALEELDVVSGFIQSEDGSKISGQIDCMIVIGSGRSIPYTQLKCYPLKQVVAVFEVKKSLRRGSLVDAIRHLADISEFLPEKSGPGYMTDESMARLLAYRPWHGQLTRFRRKRDMFVYQQSLATSLLPLRVVVGYHGYRKSSTVVKHVLNELHENTSKAFCVGTLPDIIIDEKRIFVKMMGLPYAVPIVKDKWVIIASADDHSMLILLECLFWRLRPWLDEALPAFSDHDVDPVLKSEIGVEVGRTVSLVQRFTGYLLPEHQSFARAESGLEVEEWESKMLSMFVYKIEVSIEEIASYVGLPVSTVKRGVGRLCRERVLFMEDNRVFVNLTAMRQVIDPSRNRYLVGEDSRGRFSRSSIFGGAANSDSKIRMLHVLLKSNLDPTLVEAVAFEYNQDESYMLDHVRFLNILEARSKIGNDENQQNSGIGPEEC